jgi:D-tyrosyl-tRNA(Tyr) deacylase
MRAVVQRVSRASVTVDGVVVGAIERGLLVLLGVGHDDSAADVDYLVEKIVGLRIFEDDAGKMNLALADVGGSLLVVSQFTLCGDCRKGKRPSFTDAAPPEKAVPLYEAFVAKAMAMGIPTATGKFREHMYVELVNDGPVTMLVDSMKVF